MQSFLFLPFTRIKGDNKIVARLKSNHNLVIPSNYSSLLTLRSLIRRAIGSGPIEIVAVFVESLELGMFSFKMFLTIKS